MYNPHTIINPLNNYIVNDPVLHLSALNKTEVKILNIIFKLASKYKKVHIAQSTIAQWLNMTRQQINRVIKKLTNLGIISKIHRTYDSCIYLVADFFKKPNIKEQLKTIIPNIVHLCFSIGQLICPPLRRKKMEEKFQRTTRHTDENGRIVRRPGSYREPGTYGAPYHKPWRENQYQYTNKRSGFKHITDVFKKEETNCPIVKAFKDHQQPEKVTIPEVPQQCKKLLAERFQELAPQVTPQELERLMASGRDLKERVKILESFVNMKKFKAEHGIR